MEVARQLVPWLEEIYYIIDLWGPDQTCKEIQYGKIRFCVSLSRSVNLNNSRSTLEEVCRLTVVLITRESWVTCEAQDRWRATRIYQIQIISRSSEEAWPFLNPGPDYCSLIESLFGWEWRTHTRSIDDCVKQEFPRGSTNSIRMTRCL